MQLYTRGYRGITLIGAFNVTVRPIPESSYDSGVTNHFYIQQLYRGGGTYEELVIFLHRSMNTLTD